MERRESERRESERRESERRRKRELETNQKINNIYWNSIGKVLVTGAKTIVPVNTFEKIAKGTRLISDDFLNLGAIFNIPGANLLLMGTKSSTNTEIKQIKIQQQKLIKNLSDKIFKAEYFKNATAILNAYMKNLNLQIPPKTNLNNIITKSISVTIRLTKNINST
jgi:hypothetical protein